MTRQLSSLHNVLQYIAIPVLIIIAGGSLSAFYSLGSRLRSSIQHFAAGLVFAAVSTSLLPEIIKTRNVSAMLVGFVFGTSLMLGMKWLTVKQGCKGFSQVDRPISLVVAAGVDYLVDGLLIGVAFVLGAKQGGLLTFA